MKHTISDIHSYTVFANIDKRDGNIDGHQVVLSKRAYESIENIILSEKVRLKEAITYTLQDK